MRYSCSRDARQRLFRNWSSAGRLSRSAASEKSVSAWCDNAHSILAVSAWDRLMASLPEYAFRMVATLAFELGSGACRKLYTSTLEV